MIGSLHAALATVTDVLLWPAGQLPADYRWVWAALLIGACTGLLWCWLARPAQIQVAAAAAWAGLLEIWLYRHEPSAAARSQVRGLLSNLRLLFAVLAPAMVCLALTVPLLLQVQARYGYQPAPAGGTLLATIVCDNPAAVDELTVRWRSAGQVEALVREPARPGLVARLGLPRTGVHDLEVAQGGQTVVVSVAVGETPLQTTIGGSALERLLQVRPTGLPTGIRKIHLSFAMQPWTWWLQFVIIASLAAAATWYSYAVRKRTQQQLP